MKRNVDQIMEEYLGEVVDNAKKAKIEALAKQIAAKEKEMDSHGKRMPDKDHDREKHTPWEDKSFALGDQLEDLRDKMRALKKGGAARPVPKG